MPIDPRALRLLENLRASRLAGLQGGRASITLPISEALLNELLAVAIPANAPVRKLTVRPLASNQLAVTGSIVAAPFLPPLSLTFEIEAQPAAPDWRLGLRMLSLPGFMSLAGSMFKVDSMLPPGVALDGTRVTVDLRALLERQGFGDVLYYVQSLQVRADAGRLTIAADLAIA